MISKNKIKYILIIVLLAILGLKDMFIKSEPLSGILSMIIVSIIFVIWFYFQNSILKPSKENKNRDN